MAEVDHAIAVAAKERLGEAPYYVRRIVLHDADGSLLAKAYITPWPIPKNKSGEPPGHEQEIEVLLYYGGSMPLMGLSLSMMNLLQLQGRLLRLKPLELKPSDQRVRRGLFSYFADQVETLAGADFEGMLKAEYGRP
jgi:hypothetical protein